MSAGMVAALRRLSPAASIPCFISWVSFIAWLAADQAGGAGQVIALAEQQNWFKILPEHTAHGWTWFIAAAITMMFGSIPQQDVFQRVMSAKDSDTARKGAIIGGFSYLAFAFVPMFIVASALITGSFGSA